ncbi:MAG: hypothetical protein U1F61_02195 [Opitutaceae bacterium]
MLWLLALVLGAGGVAKAAAPTEAEVTAWNAQGSAAHDRRSLDEASEHYRRVLDADRWRDPTPEERERVLALAPRLFLVAGEFFPLKDIVAVVHPDRPIIGYHLFWEDDLDFPADNEPADHEIVWIEYQPGTHTVTRVQTYLHGYVAEGPEAVADANRQGGRAWIGVEWGKHGSLPRGAAEDAAGARRVLEHNWKALHTTGRRLPDHPLARGWPLKFEGDLAAYTAFSVAFDPRPLLEGRGLIRVSRWPNATLQQTCLRYNFAPKTEWPWLAPIRR